MFQQYTTLVDGRAPSWRQIADSSSIERLRNTLSGPEHAAERSVTFTAPTQADVVAEASSRKALSVSFSLGSDTLDPNAKTVIDMGFVPTARSFAGSRIRIEGNTDPSGSRNGNIALSQRRAQAVADFLSREHGFDSNRFVVVGNGPDKLVCREDTDECNARNRRTDFDVLR